MIAVKDLSVFSRRIADKYLPPVRAAHPSQPFGGGAGILFPRKNIMRRSSPIITMRNDIAINIKLNLPGNIGALRTADGTKTRYFQPITSTDYEHYLQKTMLRNIYTAYNRLAEHAEKTASALTALTRLNTITRIREETENMYAMRHRPLEHTGVLYDDVPHPRILFEPKAPEPVSERYHTENKIRETMTAEIKAAPDITAEITKRVGAKNVAELVYKRLAEDLRRERLKRGF